MARNDGDHYGELKLIDFPKDKYLLVLPVGSGLLYVEPVYLRTKKVGLPSLARIVVSDGRLVAMDRDLNPALDQLMKKAPPV